LCGVVLPHTRCIVCTIFVMGIRLTHPLRGGQEARGAGLAVRTLWLLSLLICPAWAVTLLASFPWHPTTAGDKQCQLQPQSDWWESQLPPATALLLSLQPSATSTSWTAFTSHTALATAECLQPQPQQQQHMFSRSCVRHHCAVPPSRSCPATHRHCLKSPSRWHLLQHHQQFSIQLSSATADRSDAWRAAPPPPTMQQQHARTFKAAACKAVRPPPRHPVSVVQRLYVFGEGSAVQYD